MTLLRNSLLVAILCITGCAAMAPPKPTTFSLAGKESPLVLVPVHINGKGPFTFILDTGASTTVLSTKTAKALNLAGEQAAVATGAGGDVKASVTTLDSLAIGESRSDHIEAAIADLPHVEKAIGRSIDGVVGYNFFRGRCLELDYAKSNVRFSPVCE